MFVCVLSVCAPLSLCVCVCVCACDANKRTPFDPTHKGDLPEPAVWDRNNAAESPNRSDSGIPAFVHAYIDSERRSWWCKLLLISGTAKRRPYRNHFEHPLGSRTHREGGWCALPAEAQTGAVGVD